MTTTVEELIEFHVQAARKSDNGDTVYRMLSHVVFGPDGTHKDGINPVHAPCRKLNCHYPH